MKHIKKFNESLKWINDLVKEVKEISYILEDEGCVLEYDYNDNAGSRSPLYLEITLKSLEKVDRESDHFKEYIDRLRETVDSYIPTFDFCKIFRSFLIDGFYEQRIMIYLE